MGWGTPEARGDESWDTEWLELQPGRGSAPSQVPFISQEQQIPLPQPCVCADVVLRVTGALQIWGSAQGSNQLLLQLRGIKMRHKQEEGKS